MKRPPTKRVTINGKLWRIKVQRPPARESFDGLCMPDERTIYLHPAAIADRGLELVVHELIHARLFDIDEEAVDEIGRLSAEVASWLSRNGGCVP
jgi:hypothetical protein